MSAANVDTLLEDEDGEEEYDLGNEEEEALLAGDDDQDVHHENISYLKKSSGRKNQYVGENKMYRDSDDLLDDILDLDDVESDLENTDYAEGVDFNETQDDLDGDEQHAVVMGYHGQGMHKSLIESEMGDSHNANADIINREDMTEMLKQNPIQINEEQMEGQKDSEDEEEEEREEGRGRFKSERTTVISLKGSKTYGNIPDTLDDVLTGEEKGEVPGRWRRSGGGRGFQRGGGFRGNQRGFGSNFTGRRKQMGQNRSGSHQGGMGYAHGRGEGPMDSMRDAIGPTPSQFMLSQNIHFNPHFKGNILPQPEGPSWNEGPMVNQPPPSGGVGPPPHTPFHSLPRFPPPPVGGYAGAGGEHHGGGDMLSSYGDHQRQPRQRSPPPSLHSAYHPGPGVRAGGYDSPPNHPDFHRDEPYDNRRPPHPGDVWNSSSQRMQEGPIGLPSGGGPHHNHHHHHQQQHQQHQQYGGGHFPMSPGAPHHHGERGGEVLQHFRPTVQPGPLFSHVAPPSVAPPMAGIPNQPGLMVQQPQHHLHNVLRSAPPMHGGNGGGMGQHMMPQIPPQEQPHSRIPPPGFSPNEGRSIPSVHHGMSPWHDPPITRSPMGGQHMSMQQHSAFHHDGGAPRPFLGERPGAIQGTAMHHHTSVAAMSAPPPPFHSNNVPQGPPQVHHVPPMQHSPMRQNTFNNSSPMANEAGNSGGHNNGRFPRQGNFQQQQGYSRAPPSHQGLRPNRGPGHMSQGRGGLGSRRGMGTPNSRPQMAAQKAAGEDQFPPKRTTLPDGSSGSLPAMKVSPPKKRKVRKIVKNNLLEVETVDTLPDTTTTGDKEAMARDDSCAKPSEPVDAEILKYQKMIEEQKQLREEVLRRKEQRRKLMALQKQRELQEKAALAGEASGEVPKGNAIATIVNRNPVEPSTSVVQTVPIMQKEPIANQNFIPPLNPGQQPHPNVQSNQAQLLAARRKALIALKAARGQNPPQMPAGRGMAIRGMRGGMANQQLRSNNLVTLGSAPGAAAVQQVGQRIRIFRGKDEQGQVVRRKVPIRPGGAGRGTVLGRGQSAEGGPQPGRPTAQGRGQGVGSKPGQQVQSPGGQRLVQMLPPQQNNAQNQDSKVQANKLQRVVKVNVPTPSQQQPQTRKVVVQGVAVAGDCIAPEGSVASGSVVVENLAMSTTEGDLKKMCSTVGRVKSIRMVPGMRSAWVEFAHPTSAATFCQRYQRKIVDLSMITVRLANS